jgi:hypothetical protein
MVCMLRIRHIISYKNQYNQGVETSKNSIKQTCIDEEVRQENIDQERRERGLASCLVALHSTYRSWQSPAAAGSPEPRPSYRRDPTCSQPPVGEFAGIGIGHNEDNAVLCAEVLASLRAVV